jgi:hypothetical protein
MIAACALSQIHQTMAKIAAQHTVIDLAQYHRRQHGNVVRLGHAQLERLYGLLRERPVSGARLAAASMATIGA